MKATTERERKDLRFHYAHMLAEAGGISCSFNATIADRTVGEIPDMAGGPSSMPISCTPWSSFYSVLPI